MKKILEQQGGTKTAEKGKNSENPAQNLPPELRAKFDSMIKSS